MKKSVIIFFLLSFVTNIYSQSRIITQVDSVLKQYDSNKFPGLSIGIVKSENVVYNKGIGLANLEYGIKNSDTSVFDIASIAKQFTAACIWSLVEVEKISLDDDIRKYLPELPFYGDTMRIRHMLNHTSGLRNYSSLKELAGEDYSKEFFDNQSVFELMCRQKGLNNKPGEKVLYGNSPYNLLTIVVERITGESFNEYAIENIFKPLGMKNTYYRTNNTSIVKNRAVLIVLPDKRRQIRLKRIDHIQAKLLAILFI
jgi:CubicO group peptidase (beta-lactamase class C family)